MSLADRARKRMPRLATATRALGVGAIERRRSCRPFAPPRRCVSSSASTTFGVRIERCAVGQRDRQIGGTDEQPVDARRRRDRVEIGERGAGLDHRQRDDVVVGVRADILSGRRCRRASSARCGPQLRSPIGGNFAAATKARASAAVLIIGAMMPSAPKSSTRLDHREVAERHAHDRRRAGLAHGGDAGGSRGGVPQAVLLIERDRDKAFAGDRSPPRSARAVPHQPV